VVAIAGGDRLVPRSAGALLEALPLENESFIHARFTVAY
jgi:hypothetical protein